MKAWELKKLLENTPDEAEIMLHECTTGIMAEPKYVYLDRNGRLWFRTERPEFVIQVLPHDVGRIFNHNQIADAKERGIGSVYDSRGRRFSVGQLEHLINHADTRDGMIGSYYFTDPTTDTDINMILPPHSSHERNKANGNR